MAESYTLILNSSIDTNRTGNNQSSTFFINWNSFLPPGVDRFAMSVSVRTDLTNTVLNTTALLNVNGIGNYVIDQAGSRSSAVISIIPATNGNTNTYSYQSLYSDDNSILVDRPGTNNQVTVTWTTLNGSTLIATVPTWVVLLSFTPIRD
jgi:hypothetical protein